MATIDFDKLMGSVKSAFKDDKKETKDYNDPRFVKVSRDENDNGQLVVRFIPDSNGLGVVTVYKHFGMKVDENKNKRYFIAECPTTIEGKCPYCEKYLAAWKAKDESMIASLKTGKRNEKYISNVLVIKDPMHPENNGKVMLFDYGFKIKKLIEDMLNGDEETEIQPINIYHPMSGASLLVKHSRSGENIVLDGTKFLSPSGIVSDMDDFDGILEKTYDLNEFLDPSKFESYEVLEKKMFKYENGYDLDDVQKPSKQTTQVTNTPKEEVTQTPSKPKEATKPAVKPAVTDDDSFFDDL